MWSFFFGLVEALALSPSFTRSRAFLGGFFFICCWRNFFPSSLRRLGRKLLQVNSGLPKTSGDECVIFLSPSRSRYYSRAPLVCDRPLWGQLADSMVFPGFLDRVLSLVGIFWDNQSLRLRINYITRIPPECVKSSSYSFLCFYFFLRSFEYFL